jgi:hypothetical protein
MVERSISPIGEKGRPIPEGVLRPLASLEPAEQRATWAEATKKNPRPTGKQIRETIETRDSRG